MDRRQFSKGLIETIASYSLLRTLFTSDVLSKEVSAYTSNWVKQVKELALDLRKERISQAMWQENINILFNQISLEDLLAAVEFDKLVAAYEYPDLGVAVKRTRFPGLDDVPEKLLFGSKIFGMKKNRAIIPHGHKNMVSCHYVLKGELHLRHYDKVEEDDSHMIITPTIDEMAKVGSHSSISDEKNNIHWLKAETEVAFTYDVIVSDLNGMPYEVDNIDPYDAEVISGNKIRAKKLDVQTALEKYGHDMHH